MIRSGFVMGIKTSNKWKCVHEFSNPIAKGLNYHHKCLC